MSLPETAWEKAEVALLKAILRDGTLMSSVRLQPEHFSRLSHRLIWRTCLHLHEEGTAITPRTIDVAAAGVLHDEPEKMAQVSDYIRRLHASGRDDSMSPAEVSDHARTVMAYSEVRDQAALLQDALELAQANDIRALDAIAQLGVRAANAGRVPPAETPWPVLLQEAVDGIDDRQHHRGPQPVPCGIKSLDALSLFVPGRLVLLGGRPGMGKSALALRMITQAARQGHRALYITLEMSSDELVQRCLAMYAEVDASRIASGDLAGDDWQHIIDASGHMSGWPIAVMPSGSYQFEDVAARARQEAAGGVLKLLVIDYLQLIESPAKRNGSRQEEVDKLARSLKQLAVELDCPILALAQLGRYTGEETGTPPTLSTLRESGGQENHADAVLLLWPNLGAMEHIDPWALQMTRHVWCKVAKNRFGPQHLVDLVYNAPQVWFREAGREDA